MIILADTSVWVNHLRGSETGLRPLLLEGSVLMHPFVLGELACGNLPQRARALENFKALPPATLATDTDALGLLERWKLWGLGIGWVDAHLIASALLSRCILWTHDERLKNAAHRVGVTVP